jgi:hypothetical protein
VRRPAFRRAGPPILELVAAWNGGPPPVLPDEPEPDAALREAVALDPHDADLGRRIVREARDRPSLELGLDVLSRAGDDRDVEVLETLARHAALGSAAGESLAAILEDEPQAWWRVACVSAGAGKVDAVHRLAALGDLPAETRAWLLRHGLEGIEPEQAAHACADAGRLEHALDGLVDDALLDGACRILSGLVRAREMAAYEPGPRVARVVLGLLGDRSLTLTRAMAVEDLRGWAEDFEEHVLIAERCARLLARG